MHILTGVLVAGIMRRMRGFSALPMFRTGPVQTAHVLPGRVRFRVPSLAQEPDRADLLQDRLSQIDGVQRVAVSTGSGSVVIEYREQEVRPELLFAAVVRLLGLDRELERTARPRVVRELRSLMKSLDKVVYDRTSGLLDFSSALLILLTAVGVRKVIQQRAGAMPGGATLIWWGIHQLLGHGEDSEGADE